MSAAIVAPVSRVLAVADVALAVAFYRDVLGFTQTAPRGEISRYAAAGLIRGPARLELTTEAAAPDSTGTVRPRGAAMLFFQADDLSAMRAEITARGGAPGEIEKVNGIKMRLFQVQDPDGHVIWFGQSFQEPDTPKDPKGQLREALPELPLSDVPAGIAYYQEKLGFKINYSQDDLGVMFRDDITLLLIARSPEHRGIGSCEFYVRNADELHAELTARGADVRGEPVSRPWGLRDFRVLDGEGNRLTFAETFE